MEKESFDLLGVKGISDSIKIATQGCIDGATAFLSRVCAPALEELGLALRDKVSAWRARNAVKLLSEANTLLDRNQPGTRDKVHPRLAHVAIDEGSWSDDDVVQKKWAGLLASGTSQGGASDENFLFMNILRQLSSLQVRMLNIAVERASKFDGGHSLPNADQLSMKVSELGALVDCSDLQRFDRELDHLRELGLIGSPFAGGIELGTDNVDLTPSSLSLHFYVRAQGSKLSPKDFWKLELRSPEQQPSVA